MIDPESFLMDLLDTIPLLEMADDWLTWEINMKDCLIVAAYGRLLEPFAEQGTTPPTPETTRIHEESQAVACAAIRNRCASHAWGLIEGATTVDESFHILRQAFAKGDNVFLSLCQQFENLSLANYKNVSEYAANFRKITRRFDILHESIVIPECLLVQKFLRGLGPKYAMFRSNFNMRHQLAPSDEADEAAVTFDAAVSAAIDVEKCMSVEVARQARTNPVTVATSQASVAAGIPVGAPSTAKEIYADRTPGTWVVQPPYCTDCEKSFSR